MQKNIFLSSEADQWFKRNVESLTNKVRSNDIIYQCVNNLHAKGRVLEIGASIGYRLAWLKSSGFEVLGIEPSKSAVEYGLSNLNLAQNELVVSDASSFLDQCSVKFDVIIFGHSLYLMDPDDLPLIAANTMRLLNEGGHIVIYDFDSEPQRKKYHHRDSLYSYKMKFDNMFTWSPCFKLIGKSIAQHDGSDSIGDVHEDCALSIIRRISIDNAYPVLC